MNWSLVNGRLMLNGKHVVTPNDRKVDKALQFRGKLVVLLNSDTKPVPFDNVFCLDADGNILWQITPFQFPDSENPITDIWMEGDRLMAHFWVGIDVIVDPSTGDWKNARPGTRPW